LYELDKMDQQLIDSAIEWWYTHLAACVAEGDECLEHVQNSI